VQSFRVENAGIRDMLQDMAIEEFKTSIHDAPLFKIQAAVRTSWTVREAAGQPHTFRRAAMSCGTCGRISRPKPGRVRRTSLSDSIYEWLEKESAAVPQGQKFGSAATVMLAILALSPTLSANSKSKSATLIRP
jgi:hypothetical protein